VGKLVAALSLWLATFVVSVPYIWVLGRGVAVVGPALLLSAVVGGLIAIALASLGLLVSALAGSNRVSLSVSLFLLLALFAPTQLPSGAQQGWFGGLLVRVNPVAAGERYVGLLLVNSRGWTQEVSYLLCPVAAAALAAGVLVATGARVVRLLPGLGER
jgi:ABC-2 type transport system permease protein